MLTWIYFIPSDEDKLIDSNASQIFSICKVILLSSKSQYGKKSCYNSGDN